MTAHPDRIVERWPLNRLKPHPNQNQFFPDFADAAFDQFVEDLRQNRLDHPLDILPDGTIMGGHRRYRAALRLMWPDIEVVVRHDLAAAGETTQRHFLIRDNLVRRQLDPIARAFLARELLRDVEYDHNNPIHPARRLRDAVGELLNLSGRQVDRIIRLLELPPEIKQQIGCGNLTQSAGEKLLHCPPHDREKVVAALRNGVEAQQAVAGVLEPTKVLRADNGLTLLLISLRRFVGSADAARYAGQRLTDSQRQLVDEAEGHIRALKRLRVAN